MRKLLWWLIAGSVGGPNRGRIIMELHEMPKNAHQISEDLNLNYKTVRHHLKILEENKIISPSGKHGYGVVYFLSDDMVKNCDIFKEIWNELKRSDF
jgi:DNA-binding transcriptional ArsR family regulator